MLDIFREKMMKKIKLNRAIPLINEAGSFKEGNYDVPVALLIELIGNKYVSEITEADIRLWYNHILNTKNKMRPEEGLSLWTIDSYCRRMRAFFNHLVKLGYLLKSPFTIRPPRPGKRKQKYIEVEDISKMVQHSQYDVRDHAIVLILRDSGCRVGGLISMKVHTTRIEKFYKLEAGGIVILGKDDKAPPGVEVNFRGSARVIEKGNAERFIYFGDQACRALLKYYEVRHVNSYTELWLTQSGQPISEGGVYHIMARIAKRAGVKKFNPHAFRHAFGKKLITEGVPPRIVSDLMGHERIETTLGIYVQYGEEEIQDFYQNLVKFD